MSNEKISSLELISAISEQSGTTKKVATTFLRQFTETVEEALLRDGIVKIKGFGTFKIIWNESRSSINVNTGERYEIAGHNKITFTPDDEVSQIVNQPYAHLEPLDLDGSVIAKPADLPEEDPHMKRFSEQASEIVNLIADMQAFKPKKKAKPAVVAQDEPKEETISVQPEVVEQPVEAPAYKSIKEDVTATTTAPKPQLAQNIAIADPKPEVAKDEIENKPPKQSLEHVLAELEKAQQAKASAAPVPETKVVEQPEIKAEPIQKEEIQTSKTEPLKDPVAQPTPENLLIERMAAQPEKRSFKWLYISLIILVILGGVAIGGYFLFPTFFTPGSDPKPAVVTSKTLKQKPVVQPVAQPKTDSVAQPKVTATPKPVGETKKKDDPKPVQVESKDVFSQPRVYKEFIATETATEGTWLTMLSLKYYGHKLFWVYIYEANKDKLHNPGVLPPGTKIRIPKLDPRLIDKHNGQCFRQASTLQTVYTTKQ